MTIQKEPQARALALYQRPWWVCCYGYYPQVQGQRWRCEEPVRDQEGVTRFLLMDIKTFATPSDLFGSKAYGLSYNPYNLHDARVVVMQRTLKPIRWLTEFTLYGTPVLRLPTSEEKPNERIYLHNTAYFHCVG